MLKQIEVDGDRFELCSVDGGRTWSSDLRSLIVYKRRQERARAEAQKALEQVQEEVSSLEPSDLYQLRLPEGLDGSH